MGSDTPQTVWMREYERLRLGIVAPHMPAEFDASLAALDAHVRGLVEENERLRWALVKIAAPDADDINPFGIARAALAAPKDAP